ncbi:MAG: PolC-type DNA polymerase III [Lactovum sp.]
MSNSIYIVIDFETTGFSSSKNEIIQLAAVKFEGKKEIARYSQIVKAQRSQLSREITRLTGISSADLEKAPCIEEVFDDFLFFIKDTLIVGHNIDFDMSFLNYELDRFKKDIFFRTYDTLTKARQQMTFLQNYKLSTIKYFFDMPLRSHDALNDCLITARLYQYLENIN